MPHKLIAILLVALIWYPVGARSEANFGSVADDPSIPMFLVSAFGTAGVVHSSEDRADFTGSIFKPNGAGYTHPWSTDVDSLLGAQITANLTSQISATVQGISAQRYDNTYTPYVSWANIKYQFTPDASIRLGRTVLPSYLYSDSRNVGYANPWIRPPTEVYSLVPVLSSDGVDASYKIHTGEFVHTLLATYGGTRTSVPAGGGSAVARREWNASDTIEHGPVTFHMTYQEADLTIDRLEAFFAPFPRFGPQGVALANEYSSNNKRLRFIGLGGLYDSGNWFVVSEWGKNELHSALGDSTAWYVSSGYRFARFTPYVTYAEVKADSNTSDSGLTVSGLPAMLAGAATGLNAGLNAILASIPVQRTRSEGLRWDFRKDVDLKLQFDHTRNGAGSPGPLSNLQPDFRSGGTVNLFSAAIDFVW